MNGVKDSWQKLDVDTPGESSLKLLEALKREIIGQDDVLKDIADSFEIAEADFREKHRPRYIGLLLGPKGTGKSLTAKILALIKLGSRTALTRIDCQLLSEEHTVSKLIGSPAGYVGHKDTVPWLAQENIDRHSKPDSETVKREKDIAQAKEVLENLETATLGILEYKIFADPKEKDPGEDEKIDQMLLHNMGKRRQVQRWLSLLQQRQSRDGSERPLSILLFDEIEKAHRKVWSALLGIFEEGQITMSTGAVTSFNNTIILMTSNAGSKAISELLYERSKIIGFVDESREERKDLDYQTYKKATEAAKEIFPPEFLDRIDRISVFRPHTRESISQIFDVELRNFEEEHVRELFVKLDVAPEVKEFIVKKATDHPGNGARLLRIKIYKYLLRPLARLKNRSMLQAGNTIHVLLNSSDPQEPKLEFFREPADNLTPLLLEAGLGGSGEIEPTLNEDGTLKPPPSSNSKKPEGNDDGTPGPLL